METLLTLYLIFGGGIALVMIAEQDNFLYDWYGILGQFIITTIGWLPGLALVLIYVLTDADEDNGEKEDN